MAVVKPYKHISACYTETEIISNGCLFIVGVPEHDNTEKNAMLCTIAVVNNKQKKHIAAWARDNRDIPRTVHLQFPDKVIRRN